jgi:hypothetical protein
VDHSRLDETRARQVRHKYIVEYLNFRESAQAAKDCPAVAPHRQGGRAQLPVGVYYSVPALVYRAECRRILSKLRSVCSGSTRVRICIPAHKPWKRLYVGGARWTVLNRVTALSVDHQDDSTHRHGRSYRF